jgi:hypothetical protein
VIQPTITYGRNALTYWQIGSFIAESYLGTQIRMIQDPTTAASLVIMLMIAILSAWAAVRLFRH